ncbi:hypothetical protein IZ6_26740 [Terrihabitans soli]|uniref:Uncharacterized protein n=1 Tax=Terrihabitans soli TaxID=708113 RepID=A0A6S6QS87_9HYPH|nr:hypothetical protein [Terrihabitans soli]BCJ91939.1 hypothetical protein IZ6_26740 [Terrihabitans soli]
MDILVLVCLLAVAALAVHRICEVRDRDRRAETERLSLAIENLRSHRALLASFIARGSAPPMIEKKALLITASIGRHDFAKTFFDLLGEADLSGGYEFENARKFNAALAKLQKTDPGGLGLFHKSVASGAAALLLLNEPAGQKLQEVAFGLLAHGQEAALAAASRSQSPLN